MGFVVCALALRGLYGADIPMAGSSGKQVVLAALSRPITPESRLPGDGIIANAAATVEPSVVTIDTTSKPIPVSYGPFNDPMFRQFFGGQGGPMQQPQTQTEQGVASGVIISPDGYVLTNEHVVHDMATLKVNLADGKGYPAKVVGADPTSDIAVVKIEAPGEALRPAQFADVSDLRVGDMVIAVGNPLNVGTTVTFGIVSALGNRNNLDAGPRPLANNIIQTDAAINPGNSGGALADMNGRVIGINEAIYSPTGTYAGIGFAIPISTARQIARQLIEDGKVLRPYLGIGYASLKTLDDPSRQQIGITLKGDDGVVVGQVYPNSPAAAAGIQEYDVILEAN